MRETFKFWDLARLILKIYGMEGIGMVAGDKALSVNWAAYVSIRPQLNSDSSISRACKYNWIGIHILKHAVYSAQ